MKTLTSSKIDAINTLVDKFQTKFPDVNIYGKSNQTRSLVSNSVDTKIKYAMFRSNAAYKRFYAKGCNAYRVYINDQLLDFIVAQTAKYNKYSILATA